jgi:processive 1,2-diacylglycerol beta-glucosyltransferase
MPARILVCTAAFGEGHNSAARNLALALDEAGAEARVTDPCMLGAPVSTRWLCKGYRLITTRFPRLWHFVYLRTADVDFSKQRMPLMRKPERKLGEMVADWQPHAVVATYPLYPYFLERLLEGNPRPPKVFTVVTDSIEINAAWLKCPTSEWLVSDPHTRDMMIRGGLPAERVIDTGFPVNPAFSRLAPVAADDACESFRVLFFTTSRRLQVRRFAKAVLQASPRTQLTIVLGKNVRHLWKKAREIRDAFPGRVKIKGWTRRVPQLLSSHHLVIGKAGGATVHEALAARCPMLVHHLVPGQEEGNLQLLEAVGAGRLADTPETMRAAVTDLLADDAALWRSMKRRIALHGRNAGAIAAARHVLGRISTTETP